MERVGNSGENMKNCKKHKWGKITRYEYRDDMWDELRYCKVCSKAQVRGKVTHNKYDTRDPNIWRG